MPSRWIGNLTSHDATMFWTMKLENRAWNPSFWMMRAYFLAASFEASSLLAPVTTIFPLLKMRAVVLGSRMRMMTALNRLGLYSAFLARRAIVLSSRVQLRLTVETMF
eukprot:Amastigsp_a340097_2036.p2 type:complete len:108 gc:universal Amastigsp_a340097_2036:482-159(-)